jgi:hypothetical protein
MINMTKTDGLTATGYNASAMSNVITQNAGEPNFKKMRDIKASFTLANISISTEPNLFISNSIIESEDKLFLVKNDNTVYELPTLLLNTRTKLNAIMTSNTLPSNTVKASNLAINAYLAMDNNSNTNFEIAGNNSYIDYVFDTPLFVYGIYLKCVDQYSISSFTIEGSADGIEYATISNHTTDQLNNTVLGKTYDIQSKGIFKAYRIKIITSNPNNLVKLSTFSLVSDQGESVDTSSITNGEIPTKVFKFSDVITIGIDKLNSSAINVDYSDGLFKLISYYDDLTLDTQTLTTKVNINTTGNSLKEVIGKLYV